jgi:uncharacterized protein YprB with RNaseH-like and TPR domain
VRIENSFIPVDGVGETTERRLWESGVTHWAAFDGVQAGAGAWRESGAADGGARTRPPDSVDELPVSDRQAERIRTFVDRASDRLVAGDATYFREQFPSGSQWRCYENFRESACFLDIETTGLDRHSDDVTVVGLHSAGETTALVAGRNLTADRLRDRLDGVKLLVTYNGKRFDVPFLESAFGVSVDVPHVDLMYPCRRLGLTGGLKAVERAVGIERDRPDLSGEDAVRLWREYRRGDESALETLVSYNRDDTENLQALADVVAPRLDRAVFTTGARD